ncbi:ribosomal protein L7/L12 [Bacteroidales bacterium MSK.15.36]|nr:ribosomal protein L7/L12 [Bacteroidales bacterium MSK.15.36]
MELVRENKKIKAIKKLRESTGMGLKEAKDYVDNL